MNTKDDYFWVGFDAAIELVLNVIRNSRWGNEDILWQIEDEVENYRKDE